MTISQDLMMSILSMDAYNRGYGAGIESDGVSNSDGLGESGIIGNATLLTRSSFGIDAADFVAWQDAGFYAIAYEWEGQKIIYYRGTNADSQANFWTDAKNGYLVGPGTSNNDQAHLAADFR